jgi:5-methyltetrahydrofolate--homocysteine methyltransferase
MTAFQKLVMSQKLVLADGAWGTELAKLGMASHEAPELWNSDHPDKVFQVASSYVEAGSEIILTNTFGGNRFKLGKFGLADRTSELVRKGVEISKHAAGSSVLVFASIGPTGDLLDPFGPLTPEEVYEAFSETVTAAVEGNADGIVIETFFAIEEALLALKAAKQNSNLPVVVSMTYQHGQNDQFATVMGVTPERAAKTLTEEGADVIGANCGSGIDDIIELCAQMRLHTDRPLWMKPNAGLPQFEDGKTVYKEKPEYTASRLQSLVDAGATIVGGCCGTTPENIRLFSAARGKSGKQGKT